jgi:hypothetical protein
MQTITIGVASDKVNLLGDARRCRGAAASADPNRSGRGLWADKCQSAQTRHNGLEPNQLIAQRRASKVRLCSRGTLTSDRCGRAEGM